MFKEPITSAGKVEQKQEKLPGYEQAEQAWEEIISLAEESKILPVITFSGAGFSNSFDKIHKDKENISLINLLEETFDNLNKKIKEVEQGSVVVIDEGGIIVSQKDFKENLNILKETIEEKKLKVILQIRLHQESDLTQDLKEQGLDALDCYEFKKREKDTQEILYNKISEKLNDLRYGKKKSLSNFIASETSTIGEALQVLELLDSRIEDFEDLFKDSIIDKEKIKLCMDTTYRDVLIGALSKEQLDFLKRVSSSENPLNDMELEAKDEEIFNKFKQGCFGLVHVNDEGDIRLNAGLETSIDKR